jgi:hypothetical protein
MAKSIRHSPFSSVPPQSQQVYGITSVALGVCPPNVDTYATGNAHETPLLAGGRLSEVGAAR